MSDFEDLRLLDLLQKFNAAAEEIYATRSLSLFKKAGENLQNVYNFYVAAEKSYSEQEENFKHLFSSFNYAAVIVNNAVKNGGLKGDDSELLGECLEIMLKCCSNIIKALKN